MGHPKFSQEDFLGAALAIVAAHCVAGVTVASVSQRLGSPNGSFYHRFASRDVLLGSLWLGLGLGRPDCAGRRTEGGNARIRRPIGANSPAAISGPKSLVYQAAATPTKQQLEEQKIIEAMNTDDFLAAVTRFTGKGKLARGRGIRLWS